MNIYITNSDSTLLLNSFCYIQAFLPSNMDMMMISDITYITNMIMITISNITSITKRSIKYSQDTIKYLIKSVRTFNLIIYTLNIKFLRYV